MEDSTRIESPLQRPGKPSSIIPEPFHRSFYCAKSVIAALLLAPNYHLSHPHALGMKYRGWGKCGQLSNLRSRPLSRLTLFLQQDEENKNRKSLFWNYTCTSSPRAHAYAMAVDITDYGTSILKSSS